MLAVYLNLAKPRIMALIVVASLCSAIVAGRGSLNPVTALLLITAGALASAGAAYLNNYFDRDIDVMMERTRNRPLPKDRVNPTTVLIVGTALILISVPFALILSYLSVVFFVVGALIYGLLYTILLKRRTSLNVIIGGLSGSCAVLAGWFAITHEISAYPVAAAILVFLWTPSHFWSFALAHKESYRKANIPMLPVLVGTRESIRWILLSTASVIFTSLLLYALGTFQTVYLVGSLFFGGLFLWSNLRMWKLQSPAAAWLNFKLSGVYLLGLFIVVVLDAVIHQ